MRVGQLCAACSWFRPAFGTARRCRVCRIAALFEEVRCSADLCPEAREQTLSRLHSRPPSPLLSLLSTPRSHLGRVQAILFNAGQVVPFSLQLSGTRDTFNNARDANIAARCHISWHRAQELLNEAFITLLTLKQSHRAGARRTIYEHRS